MPATKATTIKLTLLDHEMIAVIQHRYGVTTLAEAIRHGLYIASTQSPEKKPKKSQKRT